MSGYDEFGFLHENAAEVGLPFDLARPPAVRRVSVEVPSGARLSALVWGDRPAELVLVHGGGQNAHTWDTVALALGRPLVALDLPGHGHSDWRDDKAYRPQDMADDLAAAIEALAPEATTLVGMSLGGLTALAARAAHPELSDRLAMVDVTPGVSAAKAEPIVSFLQGPETFADFDEILQRTIAHNPTRSVASLRRGVLHNAHELPDGTWAWRYDLPVPARLTDLEVRFGDLWDAVSALDCPLLVVAGGRSGVVDEADRAEVVRRHPGADIVTVPDAGHSVQGDQPLVLADLLTRFHTGDRA